MKTYFLVFLLFLCIPGSIDGLSSSDVELQLYTDLQFDGPVELIYNEHLDGLLVVEQVGKIWLVQDNEKNLFFDISTNVTFSGEMGLLGLAFHPNFSTNGLFYLDFTQNNPRRTIIAEYQTINGLGDIESERILLEVSQPYTNHNGGSILFDDEGYLYISMGDGGSGGDPQNNGQDPSTLLGSILRINVTLSDDLPYTIPESNPFYNSTEHREEIFAYGLRNPWKMTYESSKNWLIAADVGQSDIEEVNIIQSGKNYGWNTMEGSECYISNCNTTGLELPFTEYDHTVGHSITGGHVVTNPLSALNNHYVYGDFSFGKIFTYDMSDFSAEYEELLDTDYLISTFGILPSGDIIFADYSEGHIYELVVPMTTQDVISSTPVSTTMTGSSTTVTSSSTTMSVTTGSEQNSTQATSSFNLRFHSFYLMVFMTVSVALLRRRKISVEKV